MPKVLPTSRRQAPSRAGPGSRWAGVLPGAGRVLLAAVLGCLALLLAAPAAALAAGSISGEVIGAKSKAGLSGVVVEVLSSSNELVNFTFTESNGKYKVPELAAGSYKLEFVDVTGEFVSQYYKEGASFATAELVPVAEGLETTEINAALKEFARISGTVTESAGAKAPIARVPVFIFNLKGEVVAEEETNAEGKYEVSKLEAGTYKVGFNPFTELNYVPEYYNEQPSFETATPLLVALDNTYKVNAALQLGGEIHGRITDADTGAPIAHILVVATKTESAEGFGFAETNSNGEYGVLGLATGVFRLEFRSQAGEVQYITKSLANVPATQGQTTSGINAALIRRAPFNVVPPVLSGTPAVGQILSCSNGTWTGVTPLTFTYAWLRDGSLISRASGNTYVVQTADQGHELTCQVTATNSAPPSATARSNTLKVPAAPPPPPPPPPRPPLPRPPLPPPVPTIENVSQSNSRWSEGRKLASYSRKKKTPVGTTFAFVLNEQATVSFVFSQQTRGRKVRRRCVAQTRGNRHKPSCRRTVTQGTLSFVGHSGLNRVVFQGRISASQRLPLGAYTLRISAVNSVGERSSARTLIFAIVK